MSSWDRHGFDKGYRRSTGNYGYDKGKYKPRKPYVAPKKTAHAAIIISDRNDPAYEEIKLFSEYSMGEVVNAGDFETWEVELNAAIQIDRQDIPQKISKHRSVACCAFNATSEYMQSWLGMKLDSDDRSWYSLNELCTHDGLPQEHSFTVIHQLVTPYGLGVSRIIVPRNSRRFKGYHPFMVSLGCNPFFLADGNTTNEEALVKLFPDEAKRNLMRSKMLDMWKFECSDIPVKGAIVMRQFNTEATGHNGGSNYFGPRSRIDEKGWRMSVKVDRLSNISYVKPLVVPEYKEYPGTKTPDYWKIRDDSGKSLRQIETALRVSKNAKWKTTSHQKSLYETPAPKIPHPPGKPAKVLAYPSMCETCQKSTIEHYVGFDRSCEWCGTKIEAVFISEDLIGVGYEEVPDVDFDHWDDEEETFELGVSKGL